MATNPRTARRGRFWAAVVLLGWWLSPLTAWNDSFTNIPLAIAIAWLLRALGLPTDPKITVLCAYLFTNLLGIVLLWIGGRRLAARAAAAPGRKGSALSILLRLLLHAGLLALAVWAFQEALQAL